MLARVFSVSRSFGEHFGRPGQRLRWKLLIVAAALAALVGAGAATAAARLLAGYSVGAPTPPVWSVGLALLPPVACVTYACIFVYRHTARRRVLQAALTALLASLLTLTALLAGPLLARGRVPALLPPSLNGARRA
jgi:hypothetical protein